MQDANTSSTVSVIIASMHQVITSTNWFIVFGNSFLVMILVLEFVE